eukprot:6465488-Amphidinium_carterae.1
MEEATQDPYSSEAEGDKSRGEKEPKTKMPRTDKGEEGGKFLPAPGLQWIPDTKQRKLKFSNFASQPECQLPPDHEGNPLNVTQQKYEKALVGPLKGKSKTLDGTPYDIRGQASLPPLRSV